MCCAGMPVIWSGSSPTFQAYYNAARSHASLEGYTPLGFAGERTAARAEFNHVRWISHCRGMVQLPAAA